MRIVPAVVGICATVMTFGAYAANCAGFTDVDSANTYCPAVTYIKNKGITLGCGNGTTFCPNDYVTRLQMALFLQRAGRGGPNNTVGDSTTVVGGGDSNSAMNQFDVVGGGYSNTARETLHNLVGQSDDCVDCMR